MPKEILLCLYSQIVQGGFYIHTNSELFLDIFKHYSSTNWNIYIVNMFVLINYEWEWAFACVMATYE